MKSSHSQGETIMAGILTRHLCGSRPRALPPSFLPSEILPTALPLTELPCCYTQWYLPSDTEVADVDALVSGFFVMVLDFRGAGDKSSSAESNSRIVANVGLASNGCIMFGFWLSRTLTSAALGRLMELVCQQASNSVFLKYKLWVRWWSILSWDHFADIIELSAITRWVALINKTCIYQKLMRMYQIVNNHKALKTPIPIQVIPKFRISVIQNAC